MLAKKNIVIRGTEILIPTDLENLRNALLSAQIMGISRGPYQVERVSENLSPFVKVYSLTSDGGKKLIIRMLDITNHTEETEREIRLMRKLSEKSVVPPMHYCNDSTGVIIMQFIQEAQGLSDSNARENSKMNIIKLIEKIRIIHALPLEDRPYGLLPSNLQKERLDAVQAISIRHEELQIYLQGIEHLNIISEFIKQSTLCHNNLHRKNILFGNEDVYIIDWETVGIGDPFLDLANFLCLSRCSSQEERYFLTVYLDRDPTVLEVARFEIMKQVSNLRYSLGLLATVNINDLNIGKLELDKIPVFSDRSVSRSVSRSVTSNQERFVLSVALLKEAFAAINSPEISASIRTVRNDKIHSPQIRFF